MYSYLKKREKKLFLQKSALSSIGSCSRLPLYLPPCDVQHLRLPKWHSFFIVQVIDTHERARHVLISEYYIRSHITSMTLCKHCKNINLINLWVSKSPQNHQPSFLALTLSAENCPGCDIILSCLLSFLIESHLFSISLDQAVAIPQLNLVTINEYKYATTVSDCSIKIDSLLFYFDEQKQIPVKIDIQNECTHKADSKYFSMWLDAFADSDEQ